ncbi:MAG TPA: ATP-binding protein [Candidatus Margulisiibacteriota bacterium]|nr:ATP-binding protein [Candidatus Margulisiibacteriota bacterium]
MTYHWIPPLFAAVTILILAFTVNRRGMRTPTRDLFTFLACMLVLWNLNFFVLYSVSDRDVAFALTRIFRVGSLFMPPAILHLILSLRDERSRAWSRALAFDYGIACLLAAANSVDALASDLRPFPWGFSSVGGPFYNLFSVFVLANCSAALLVLVHDYRASTEPRMRLQLKFWLVGAWVAVPLGLTNLLPSYGVRFYPLGSLGNAAWVAIVAYAIVRHRLMDIDVAVTKGMAYAGVSLVITIPAFALTLWLQQLSFGQIHSNFSAVILLMFVAIGALFPSLRMRAESRIERSLFREKHQYRTALVAFTRSIVRILDKEKLLNELTSTLTETLGLDRIAIALADEGRRVFSVRQASSAYAPAELPAQDEILASLRRHQRAVLRDELEASSDQRERDLAAQTCRRNGWEVCIPLSATGNLIGFIALGRKRNLDAFFAEDLELLETLAGEASVALENARLYGELKRSQDIIRRADRLSALGTLAAGIAHEVRNPLVSIQTFFQLAPDRLHDEEFFTTFLAMTAKEVRRISDLITELLSFARSPTRTLAPVDLNDVVDRVATLLDPEARKHRLGLLRELHDNVPLVRADNDQIKQVLINLVLNGIQATPPGGVVTVATRAARRSSAMVGQFIVSDTGTGIPQDEIDHIFDPFFTTKDKGTGLGLAIVHQIIMEHGGSISVESKPGVGTSFVVDLPLADQIDAQDNTAQERGAESSLPRRLELTRRVAAS